MKVRTRARECFGSLSLSCVFVHISLYMLTCIDRNLCLRERVSYLVVAEGPISVREVGAVSERGVRVKVVLRHLHAVRQVHITWRDLRRLVVDRRSLLLALSQHQRQVKLILGAPGRFSARRCGAARPQLPCVARRLFSILSHHLRFRPETANRKPQTL